jgi:hypothetical protein
MRILAFVRRLRVRRVAPYANPENFHLQSKNNKVSNQIDLFQEATFTDPQECRHVCDPMKVTELLEVRLASTKLGFFIFFGIAPETCASSRAPEMPGWSDGMLRLESPRLGPPGHSLAAKPPLLDAN